LRSVGVFFIISLSSDEEGVGLLHQTPTSRTRAFEEEERNTESWMDKGIQDGRQREEWKVSGLIDKNGDLESEDISDFKKPTHTYVPHNDENYGKERNNLVFIPTFPWHSV
jgi:hypothetical protein